MKAKKAKTPAQKLKERKAKLKKFNVESALERERMRDQINEELKVPVVKNVTGRPSMYTDELAKEICTRIATSSISLKRLCEQEGMPCAYTIITWRHERPVFAEMYTRAKADQALFLAEEAVEIADTTQVGEKTEISPLGMKVSRADMTEHRRLRVETRKWYAAKMNPRLGDKVALVGANDGPIQVHTNDPDATTDEQLLAIALAGKPTPPEPTVVDDPTED